jgi:hypothetical protein
VNPVAIERVRVASVALDDAVAALAPDDHLTPEGSELTNMAADLDRLWRTLEHGPGGRL